MACRADKLNDDGANSLPCPAHLALALMVLRSKPPHMSIEGLHANDKCKPGLLTSLKATLIHFARLLKSGLAAATPQLTTSTLATTGENVMRRLN